MPTDTTSSHLGIIPRLRWMFSNPRLAPWLPAAIMLVVPELLAIGLEGRVANPLRQYLGVFPGDVFLSFAIGASLWLAINHLDDRKRWYQSWGWHALYAGTGVLFAGFVFYGEITNTIYRYVPSAAYTWPQLLSPTNLFHYAIVVVMVYLLWAVVLPAQLDAPRRFWWLKVLIVLALVGWAMCAVWLDNSLPRPNLGDVHGSWFGGWYAG